MLEVHPPHETAHSWKDFLLHIATICVGLLIAVALEQTVEAVHRAGERRELREELVHESEQMLKDSESCVKVSFGQANWAGSTLLVISNAAREHQPLSQLPQPSSDGGVLPSDPIFRSATLSNKMTLLTRQEVEAFSEMHLLVQDLDQRVAKQHDANLEYSVAISSLAFGMDPTSTFQAQTTTADLKPPFNALIRLQRALYDGGESCYILHAAAKAITQGERDLGKIEEAEAKGHAKLAEQIAPRQKAPATPAPAPAPAKK